MSNNSRAHHNTPFELAEAIFKKCLTSICFCQEEMGFKEDRSSARTDYIVPAVSRRLMLTPVDCELSVMRQPLLGSNSSFLDRHSFANSTRRRHGSEVVEDSMVPSLMTSRIGLSHSAFLQSTTQFSHSRSQPSARHPTLRQ